MSRQSCRRNINRLRLHRSYILCRSWPRRWVLTSGRFKDGTKRECRLLMSNQDLFLFLGKTIRSFLKNRLQKRRTVLGPNEIYCLGCAKGVVPFPEKVSIGITDRRLGRHSKLVIVRAECPHCHSVIVRFASLHSIGESVWWTKLRQADEGLSGASVPSRNTDSKQG